LVVWEWRRKCENDSRDVRYKQNIPVMTFPIKKRIGTELFIDRKWGLFIQNDIKKTFWPHYRGWMEIGRKIKVGMRTSRTIWKDLHYSKERQTWDRLFEKTFRLEKWKILQSKKEGKWAYTMIPILWII